MLQLLLECLVYTPFRDDCLVPKLRQNMAEEKKYDLFSRYERRELY